MPAAPHFALSVDVEDYFQVWAFSGQIARKDWDSYPLRVEASTRRALDLFDEHNAKATFFTLGWIAERAPALIREIAARGHEVASHGYDHAKVFEQSRDEFREDAGRSKKLLEDLTGEAVAGYRAPGFSIDARTSWAHETLAALGYRYSSSSHPISHDHYGDPNAPRAPFRPIETSGFLEAPVATADVFGRRVSCAGGGWFRAAPYAVSKALIARARSQLEGPVIFYFHPWELDPDQPRIAAAPLKSKFRHYLNLGTMEKKLARFLADHAWARIDETLGLGRLKAAA